MNIEQIKSDLESGIIVSRATLVKLVEAALIMQDKLDELTYNTSCDYSRDVMEGILEDVEAM